MPDDSAARTDPQPEPVPPTDKALVERAKAGDEPAMQELFRRHHDGLYIVVLRQLRDEQRAKAAVLESFADAFRRLPHFAGRAAFGTWLFHILRTRVIRQIKLAEKQAAERGGYNPDEMTDTSLMPKPCRSPEELHDIRQSYLHAVAAIQQLPPDQATVFTLHFVVGMPVKEVMAVLNLTEEAVRMRISRGRRRLQELLKDG
jgi:RNA polymerase sigma-70 factor (ECF subfamily)